MRRLTKRSRSSPVALLAAGLLVACGTALDPVSEPWDRPVSGARSTTEWTEEGVVRDQFRSSSTEEILELVAQMESAIWATDEVSVGFAGTNASGTVVGYARTTMGGEHPLRGVDLRFDMRNDTGSWEIVAIERRFHCAVETATDFCE